MQASAATSRIKTTPNAETRQRSIKALLDLLDQADGQDDWHGTLQVAVTVQAGRFTLLRVTPERTYRGA